MSEILEALSEDEAYLWAILSDESGLDQAEFSWFDYENEEDNCWRAWPYQWPWFRDDAMRQIDQSARSVGKSMSIKIRAYAFPFVHPGQEMLVTAPEGIHLSAITNLVEKTFLTNRMGREMLVKKNNGITHKPFEMSFRNDSRIMGRIPHRDGAGVKGVHPIWVEHDEASDYPTAGWVELIETMKRGSKGAHWRVHGVTRGVRDYFYRFTQSPEWKVHRVTAMHRPPPFWSDEERQQKIEEYTSKDHPDYRRNILGMHGDATNPLFVLHRLMAVVDTDEESEYNTDIYQYIRLTAESLEDAGGQIDTALNLNMRHQGYAGYWIGMDVGYLAHPSEIVVFGEVRENKKEPKLVLLLRVKLERLSHNKQVDAIFKVMDFYNPKAYSMDSTGIGLPLFQDLQERRPELAHNIKAYNFSQKILVDFDSTVDVDEFYGDKAKEAGISRNVLEYSSDKLREMVDTKKILLPMHRELLEEFQGQTWSVTKSKMDQYGRTRDFSKGAFHCLDACKMAVLGYTQHGIEAFMKKEKFEAVTDVFF